jgi:hypothetical protein
MTGALNSFRIGQRVQQTALWQTRCGRKRGPDHGVVIGFADRENVVEIQRDNVKKPDLWLVDFWEPEAPSPKAEP